ncbi:MAG TPA: hypothetical protein VFH37_01605 [Candidatus Saccharimonadales bacterium]|nr:hypothetical protein [Candidatus Saccharimonadales bacterium]
MKCQNEQMPASVAETMPEAEKTTSSSLWSGSQEMIEAKQRLQAQRLGGHVGQLAIELYQVEEPNSLV